MLKLWKIERFISKFRHKVLLAIKGFITEREIKRKSWELFKYCLAVSFTGVLIHYSLTHFNWLSIGLTAAWTTYYVEWLIKLIKRKD